MSRRIEGILSTLLKPASWRSFIAKRRAIAFDRKYGTETRRIVEVSAMGWLDPVLAAHAVQYEASAIPKFERGLAAVGRAIDGRFGEYSFIDVGSGKGLVVMLAAQWPFKQVCGVEMAAELHRSAEANVARYFAHGTARSTIDLYCADALTFPWPDGGLVLYLYNPFDAELTARFVQRVHDTLSGQARCIYIVYVNPVHEEVFVVDARLRRIFSDQTLSVYEVSGWPSERSGVGHE